MRKALLMIALVMATSGVAHAEGFEPRVMVIPVQGSAPPGFDGLIEEVETALSNGAGRLTPNVSRSTAALDDTAVIVGCDPVAAECLDAIAAALNVDQLLIADISASGADAKIEVIAVTREADPVRQGFVIQKTTRAKDLRALEEAVPVMLEAGEARKVDAKEPPPPDPDPDPDPDVKVVASPTRSGGRSIGPMITMGAGVALGIGGAALWTLAARKQDEIDAAPTTTAQDLDRLASLESEARMRATVGNILVIGGALAIGAGIVWYLVDGSGVEVSAAPTPGGAEIAIGGRW